MARMIALPDLHNNLDNLPRIVDRITPADILLLPGDMSQSDDPDVIRTIRDTATTEHVLAVPGNWDGQRVTRYLDDTGINLHQRRQVLQGVTFLGLGGSLPFIGRTEYSEDDYARFTADLAAMIQPDDEALALVSHQPPSKTLCALTRRGDDAGSANVRAFIEQVQPLICVCGHIHEGRGVDHIGRTAIINPGPLADGHYAEIVIEQGDLLRAEVLPI